MYSQFQRFRNFLQKQFLPPAPAEVNTPHSPLAASSEVKASEAKAALPPNSDHSPSLHLTDPDLLPLPLPLPVPQPQEEEKSVPQPQEESVPEESAPDESAPEESAPEESAPQPQEEEKPVPQEEEKEKQDENYRL